MKQVISIFALFLAVCAHPQWTVVNLHPAGATGSTAQGVADGQQVGWAIVDGVARASLWTGSAASWVNLNPAGASGSNGYGVGGGRQTGHSVVGGVDHASLWDDTAGSWVDLHPVGVGVIDSVCEGGGAVQQVGYAHNMGGSTRASLWTGSAGSWVNLHPPGAGASFAKSADGVQQVGYGFFPGIGNRAILWTGTAASWVDLSGGDDSSAFGVSGGQQVGSTGEHASLWSGTAASRVDLHPGEATSSRAVAVSGGQQVGAAVIGGVNKACLWRGTAASWVDLHALLPAGFTWSGATGISHDGGFTYVVGTGVNSTTGRGEALMWISRAVAPASFTTIRGIVTGGNLASLLNSDDNRLVIRPGIVFTTGEAPVQIRVDATAPAAFPNGIAFSVESSASFGNAQQKIWLWNYAIGNYELVDTRLATLTDDVTNVTIRTNSSRFIQPGALAIRALVSYRAIGPAFAYPWSARIDKVWWTFPG